MRETEGSSECLDDQETLYDSCVFKMWQLRSSDMHTFTPISSDYRSRSLELSFSRYAIVGMLICWASESRDDACKSSPRCGKKAARANEEIRRGQI